MKTVYKIINKVKKLKPEDVLKTIHPDLLKLGDTFLENNKDYYFKGKEELENLDIDNHEQFNKKIYENEKITEGETIKIDINENEMDQISNVGNLDLTNPEVARILQEKLSNLQTEKKKEMKPEDGLLASKEEIKKTQSEIFKTSASKNPKGTGKVQHKSKQIGRKK